MSPRVWTEEERDMLAETFKQANARHGHYETLFAVAGKALDLRNEKLHDLLAKWRAWNDLSGGAGSFKSGYYEGLQKCAFELESIIASDPRISAPAS